MKTHLFSYSHNGKRWEIEIQAHDAEDAKQRIGKLAYATYDGVLVTKVPAALGPLAVLTTHMRNTIGTLIGFFRRIVESK